MARKSAARRVRAVMGQEPNPKPEHRNPFHMRRLVADFLEDHCTRRQVAPLTREYYEANLARFLDFCQAQGISSPKHLTPERAEAYVTWVLKQPKRGGGTLGAHTAHKAQRALRMFTKWLAKKGYLREDPAADQEMVRFRSDQEIKHLSEEELRRVLAIPDKRTTSGLRLYLTVYLLAATGIREGELRGLIRSDIQDKDHLLRVRAEISKSKRERFIPLPEVEVAEGQYKLDPEFGAALGRYLLWRKAKGLKADDALFVGNDGKPLSRYAVASQLSRLGQEVGVTLSARTFRHTAAVLLLKRTGDLDLAYEVLGHSSFDVTKKYLRFAPKEIQERYRRANILGAMRQPRKLSMRDVDKALRKHRIAEEKLGELLFEVEMKEGWS